MQVLTLKRKKFKHGTLNYKRTYHIQMLFTIIMGEKVDMQRQEVATSNTEHYSDIENKNVRTQHKGRCR